MAWKVTIDLKSTDATVGEDDDSVDEARDVTIPKHGMHEYFLKNAWAESLTKLKKDNYVEVTVKNNERKDRKRAVAKFIRKVVLDAKENDCTVIGSESAINCIASWSETVHNLDRKYYS